MSWGDTILIAVIAIVAWSGLALAIAMLCGLILDWLDDRRGTGGDQ